MGLPGGLGGAGNPRQTEARGDNARGFLHDQALWPHDHLHRGSDRNNGSVAGPETPGLDTSSMRFPPDRGTMGISPAAGGLAMDATGTLYGTTLMGAIARTCGTSTNSRRCGRADDVDLFASSRFSLQPIGSDDEDGIAPTSPLTYFQGVLYGTASAGGDTSCGCGIVFSITPGGTYTILHTFGPAVPGAGGINEWPNGTTPIGGQLISNGTIYGTTDAGGKDGAIVKGTNGAGTIYSLSTTGSGFTVLHSFDGSANTGPQGMIIFGQDGALYGTQFGGGQYDQGVIWRMPIGGTYQVLYNFQGNIQIGNSTDGADPEGELALGPDGTIYGTTSFGGNPSGDGTAWSIKLTIGTWVYKQIYKFNGNTGARSRTAASSWLRTAPSMAPPPAVGSMEAARSTSWCPTAAHGPTSRCTISSRSTPTATAHTATCSMPTTISTA